MSPQTKRFVGVAMIITALFIPVLDAGVPELLLMVSMVAAGSWLVRESNLGRAALDVAANVAEQDEGPDDQVRR